MMASKNTNTTQMHQNSKTVKGGPKMGYLNNLNLYDVDSESDSESKTGSYTESGSDSESGADSESGSSSSETDGSREDNIHEEELQNEESSEMNGRGEARIAEDWSIEGKIHELQLNDRNQVIGENAAPFATYLGILAKDGNKLPLTYSDWRLVPKAEKERIWEDVKGKTNLPSTYSKICLQRVGKLWKDWKATVKAKHFTPYKHDTNFLAKNIPGRVEVDQWPHLVRYWNSKKAIRRSKVNRRSRKKQTMPHRTGRKDLANVREELKLEMGEEPSKLDVFVRSRQGINRKRASKPLDETTAKMIDMANELKEQLPEAERNDASKKNEIYHKLLGPEKPGGVRTYGIGAASTRFTGASSQMPMEWAKVAEEKVGQLFDGLKSEMEKHFLDMMEHQLPKLMEKYRDVPSNLTPSSDQVHECTKSQPTDKDKENTTTYEQICGEDDTLSNNDVVENRTSQEKSKAGVEHESTEDTEDILEIPPIGTTVKKHVSIANETADVCPSTRELRSKTHVVQRNKNDAKPKKDGEPQKKKRRKHYL